MKVKHILSLTMSIMILAAGVAAIPAQAAENTPSDMNAFNTWNTSKWAGQAANNSDGIVLTPGKTASELNFAWYSKTKGTPQVRFATDSTMTQNVQTFTGTAAAISRTNGVNAYAASNKVTATGLKELSVYYYTYSADGTTWSIAQKVKTQSASSLQIVCVGDPQIGASSGFNKIAYDTYQWNNTLTTALSSYPDVNFILSVGDQINQASDGTDGGVEREMEYAGFLYPSVLRGTPLVTAIGNHESLSTDYSLHYNDPNISDNLGSTASGSDYYFNYGKVLFIVLNSNNRNSAEHDRLMAKAINDPSSANAEWKIAVMHHDIYGSGSPHSDVDGANLRALFAPLMDKYNIDVCLTGHDHSYTRAYQMIDGKAVTYAQNSATDPEGTLYMAFNSASGSKYYELNSVKQYYVAQRSQLNHPNYSVLSITDGSLSIKTLDAVNNSTIDTYTVNKTQPKQSLYNLIVKAGNMVQDSSYSSTYTPASRTALENALKAAGTLLDTGKDGIPEGLYGNYDNSVQGDNSKDILNYYAYYTATGLESVVNPGYCDYIDKSMNNQQALLTNEQIESARQTLQTAINGLVKVTAATKTSATTAPHSGSPKTGDNTESVVIVFALLLAVSSTAVTIARIRKNIKSADK